MPSGPFAVNVNETFTYIQEQKIVNRAAEKIYSGKINAKAGSSRAENPYTFDPGCPESVFFLGKKLIVSSHRIPPIPLYPTQLSQVPLNQHFQARN